MNEENKPTYNVAVLDISDRCKTPDFRKQFRHLVDKGFGMPEMTFDDAFEDIKIDFLYKNNVCTERYRVTCIKNGRTYFNGKPAISYIAHPINIEYKGAYF